MSYRSGYGGGFPSKKPITNNQTKQGYSMNAVPPPSSLLTSGGRHSGGSGYHHNIRKNTTTNNFNATQSSNVASGGGGGGGGGDTAGGGSNSNISKHGYSTMDAIAQFANCSQYAVGSKRKTKTEDEYFDDDEETATDLAYIPAPGSPSAASGSGYNRGNADNNSDDDDDDDEEDPLDAFMSGLEKHLEKENTKKSQTQSSSSSSSNVEYNPKKKGVRTDIDDEDDEESYYRYMEENPNAGVIDEGSDNEIEYDEDGNPIAPARRRDIDPLPAIDHTEIEYKPFEKNFYEPHEEIAGLSRSKVDDLRHTLGIRVTGPVPPKPVVSFAHFGFDETLMKQIRKSEYIQPTAIQSQAIPAAMSGRDLIGIAKTGSGKTAAFIWPMLVHIMDQRQLQLGDGPIGLILAPTRELSLQIYNEAKKFGKIYNINVVCCYGGGSKWEQSKALEQGAEVVVATPGRMIDMVKMKATNLRRVTYLVLDEADRMFNMGFEPQVRSICNHVRPDRQTMLFSATFKKRIEKLARDVLTDPVRIVQGDLGEANEDITQHMIVFTNPAHKWNWLLAKLVELLSNGSVLIFVTKKADAETVANNLQLNEYEVVLLHGDMDQADRNKVIMQFKRKEVPLMVATDVAARGLDIPHIKTVVNYDIARDIDTHTHRIGRTGRAGEKGTAYTLVIEKDKEFAGHLVRNLEGANQEVPEALLELAMQSSWFRKSRFKCGKGKTVTGIGGAGLGYRERPSFSGGAGGPDGTASTSSSSTGETSGSKGRGGNWNDSGRNVNESGPAPKSSTKGPITNRFLAMKETFRSQYNSQFRASTDRTWEQTVPETGVFIAPSLPPPPPPPPPSMSSGTNRKHNQSQNNDASANDDVESANKPIKRNRWD